MEKHAKEHPILFSGPLIRAILSGKKTQTRRLLRWDGVQRAEPCPVGPAVNWSLTSYGGSLRVVRCPYGQPGDRLWVRETWKVGAWRDDGRMALDYRAGPLGQQTPWIHPPAEAVALLIKQSLEDCVAGHQRDPAATRNEGHRWVWDVGNSPCRWRPSIHMPRWASRINLEVTEVRVQRLQDITEEDARAEGVPAIPRLDGSDPRYYRQSFAALWDSLAPAGQEWADNPWVWAVSFKRLNGGSDV